MKKWLSWDNTIDVVVVVKIIETVLVLLTIASIIFSFFGLEKVQEFILFILVLTFVFYIPFLFMKNTSILPDVFGELSSGKFKKLMLRYLSGSFILALWLFNDVLEFSQVKTKLLGYLVGFVGLLLMYGFSLAKRKAQQNNTKPEQEKTALEKKADKRKAIVLGILTAVGVLMLLYGVFNFILLNVDGMIALLNNMVG